MRLGARVLMICGVALGQPGLALAQQSAARPPAADDAVAQLITAALDTLRRVTLHQNVDWARLRDSAFLLARGARERRDAYPVIEWLLQRVDQHSFLQARRRGTEGRLLRTRIGYVRVPFFAGGMVPAIADTLQTSIRTLDQQGACGWIVDLRNNGGGNMWPMLAGIGPLLGDTISGWNEVGGRRSYWHYKDGASGLLEEGQAVTTLVTISVTPHTLRNPAAPVAVLTDGGTGSSGEAMATAFRGRPNARSFGAATSGSSTVNNGYRLPDGSNAVITIGVYVDRIGRRYGGALMPDEEVATPLRGATSLEGDPVVARALAWLEEQPACAARR